MIDGERDFCLEQAWKQVYDSKYEGTAVYSVYANRGGPYADTGEGDEPFF